MITRRQFAQSVTAAVGAAAVTKASEGCLGPAPHYLKAPEMDFGALSRVAKECRTLPVLDCLDRPLLSSLQDKPERTKELAHAYDRLAKINGNTGLLSQARRHGYMCDNGVHDSWAFLLWHRGFLYFHERILVTLTRKDFRLPAWDWENSPVVPKPWSDFNAGDQIVQACPRLKSLKSEVDPCRLQAWLFSDTFEEFAGDGGQSANAFAGVHNDVHVGLGGAMAFPPTAASDPLFYAHHVNVDRYWWYWHNQLGLEPRDQAFFDQKFYFYDETGAPVSVRAHQLMDPALLGYRYDHDTPTVSLKLNSTPVEGLISKALRSELLSTAITWLKSKDEATQVLARVEKLGAYLGEAAPSFIERSVLRRPDYSELVELVERKATPFPVRITARVRPGTVSSGHYYRVALRTKKPEVVPFAGFGVFGHDSSHSGQIMATGCIGPEALRLLLTDPDLEVVYYVADASGDPAVGAEVLSAGSWSLLSSK